MSEREVRTHEITFCSRVAGWVNALFGAHPEWPFRRAEIEESKAIRRKRSDLRIHGHAGKLLLAGEVKMPGTVEGRSPYNADLVDDPARKADNAAAEFFFTWNVNQFVLFDRKKWHLPVMERRVKEYPLGLDLETPSDVDRPDAEARIKAFLADFFGELAAIIEGKQPEWGMRLDEWFIRAFESHVSWSAKLTAEFLSKQSAANKTFHAHLQDWMVKWTQTRSFSVSSPVARPGRNLCHCRPGVTRRRFSPCRNLACTALSVCRKRKAPDGN